jgi:hypothetical protein
MDVNGELIRLDPKANGTSYEPKDWELVEGRNMMRHKPTGCIFQIFCDDQALGRGRATVLDFSARLIHVCDNRRIPTPAQQVPLGRAAIVILLQETGAWKPVVITVPDRPSRRQGKRRPA